MKYDSATSFSLSSKQEKLLKRRLRERARRAAETAKEKELKLTKRRSHDRAQRAAVYLLLNRGRTSYST